MNAELEAIIDTFNRILHLYSVIDKKPKEYGTGDLLYVSEIHAIYLVGKYPELNLTRLSELAGVTKGAVSQMVKRLVSKRYIAKYKITNNKEVNIRLSDKGYIIYQHYLNFAKERFVFAEEIYRKASKDDIDLVKRLFTVIHEHMKQMAETQ
jgi:DNA-binding MarR family transcriptional regulator